MATVEQLEHEAGEHEVGFKRLLVAYDSSRLADLALEYALDFALLRHIELRVIHALGDGCTGDSAARSVHGAEESLAARIDEVTIGWPNPIQPLEFVVRAGSVCDVLMKEVEEWKPDVVLLGAYGHDLPDRDRLGSTAEALLRSLPCAVVTIGPRVATRSAHARQMRLIVCPVDLPEESFEHVEMIARVAKTLQAKVSLVHAVETPDSHLNCISVADMQFQCGRLVTRLLHEGVLAESTLLYGSAAEKIAEHALDNDASYILFGLHKSGNFSSYFHKSLVAKVIKMAPCGIFTYPQLVTGEHHVLHPMTTFPASESVSVELYMPIDGDGSGNRHRSHY